MLNKDAGDRSGLIYGVGHAVYTLSDPRCRILKENALRMPRAPTLKGNSACWTRWSGWPPPLLREKWGSDRSTCANVDLYSGLVYRMLGIPDELHTPMFAIARTAGWCAHRMEELTTNGKIIRRPTSPSPRAGSYLPLQERG